MRIEFQDFADGDAIRVVIEDNGIGLNAPAQKNGRLKEKKSLGLSIVKNQIQLLNQKNGNQIASIEIKDIKEVNPTQNGVKVTVVLPCKYGIDD